MKTSGANGLSRYRRRTASEWQELISRFDGAGQTRKAFCLSQGVSLSTFDLWRRKLRGRTAERSESMFVEVSPVETERGLVVGCRAGARWRGDSSGSKRAVMLNPTAGVRIWLCTQPTDMRCSFDGLSARVRRHLGEDPTSGHWFVFVNRRRSLAQDSVPSTPVAIGFGASAWSRVNLDRAMVAGKENGF